MNVPTDAVRLSHFSLVTMKVSLQVIRNIQEGIVILQYGDIMREMSLHLEVHWVTLKWEFLSKFESIRLFNSFDS